MHLKNIHKLFLVFQATTLVTIAGIGRSTVDCSTCVGTCVYEPTSESTICYKKLSQVSLQVGAEAPPPVAPQESQGDRGATFTLVNNCSYTIWPAIQGNPDLGTTGIELPKGGSRAIHAPPSWTGRLWGRTGCTFNGSANGSCTTGDTVATLAEFGLGSGSVDIYDVSLVDGFNLPLRVDAVNGSGQCASVGCVEDLIQKCPEELRSEGGGACRSACVAFNTTVHCCRGSTCKPTLYSQLFKNACPLAYSYATDDANSTFTCTAADYVITFCASSMSLRKNSSKSEDGRGGLIAGIVLVVTGIVLVPILVILCCCKCCCKRRRSPGGPNQVSNQDIEKLLLQHGSLALKRFKYSKIKKITKSFSDKLGQGGYGSVYKGELPDGCIVAVKVLIESDSNGEEFINEVASISRTSHVNIVNLLGFCFDKDKRALVYQYMPNKSLDKFISNSGSQDSGSPLDMKTLYNIAVGVAKGLEYLHNGCNTRIVHFDIKPQNILLDEDLCPKISDFGLAKLCKKKQSALSMLGTRGTIGYIAPEVFSRNFGVVSHKSDVYSYGMMVLEMAGARNTVEVEPIQSSENYFPDKIYEQVILDFTKKLDDFTFEEEEIAVKKMLLVGFWCIQTIPSDRPSISKVVEMLEGSLRSIQIPPHPVLVTPNLPAQDVSLSFSTYARSEKSDEV